MDELLDELVSNLLGTFTTGVRLLKSRRRRNREINGSLDPASDEEKPLINSLRRSRSEIREAYKIDTINAGPKFSKGDGTIHYLQAFELNC